MTQALTDHDKDMLNQIIANARLIAAPDLLASKEISAGGGTMERKKSDVCTCDNSGLLRLPVVRGRWGVWMSEQIQHTPGPWGIISALETGEMVAIKADGLAQQRCANCKHSSVHFNEEPCNQCDDFMSKWVAVPPKENGGGDDLVTVKADRLAELEQAESHLVALQNWDGWEAAEAAIACWDACVDAGLTVRMLRAGIVRQAMKAMVDYAHSQAIAAPRTIAYIIRDEDGHLYGCPETTVQDGASKDVKVAAYGPLTWHRKKASSHAARIGGTISAIVTDGADVWEADPE